MSNKKILIIKLAPYDSLVSSNMRMLALMKGLDQLGYSMDLLTVPKSVVLVDNDMSEYPFLERVNIVYAGQSKFYEAMEKKKKRGIIKHIYTIAKKIYHKFFLYDHTVKVAKAVSISILPSKEYEYVIAVSDPKTTYIALRQLLKQGLKAKKIIEYWGDPLFGDITQKTLYPSFILKREERRFLSMANKIVYTSPMTLQVEQKIFPEFANIMVYIPTANASQKLYPNTENDLYTVGYYGGYKSTVRNIMPLYEAFKLLIGKARLNLVGDTDLNLPSTENVIVKSRGIVRELKEGTDLFVCVLNSSGTQIPGKLYHMAATNRPILVILDGEMKDSMYNYIMSFDRFMTCENNTKSIAQAILEIMKDKRPWKPCIKLEPSHIAIEMLK